MSENVSEAEKASYTEGVFDLFSATTALSASGLMLTFLKRLILQRRHKDDAHARRLILIGIDVPSHSLGSALQQRGAALIAFIDEEPWNHRTLMLKSPVHYPSELLALVQKHAVDTVVRFHDCKITLADGTHTELRKIGARLVEINQHALNLEEQIERVIDTNKNGL